MKVTPRKISASVAPSARTTANVRTVSFANIYLICNIPSASHGALCDNTTCQVWWTAATSGSRKSPRTFPRTQSNCKLNIFHKYSYSFYCRRLENNQITEIGPHAFQSAGRLKRMWADDHSEFATFSTLIVAEICPETSWGRCQPRHSTTIRDLQLCKYFFHSFFIYQNQVEPRSIRSSSNDW